MLKENIAKLLSSEMDRKSFLKTAAVTAVALTGATTVVKTLVNQPATRQLAPASVRQNARGMAYGTSFYNVSPN